MIKFLIGIFLGAVIQNLVARYLKERARLVYYLQNISDHDVQLPVRTPSNIEPNPPVQTFRIYTHSITIRNNGERIANNVEVTHAFLPRHITINPSNIQFTIDRERRIIRFNSIVPNQMITIGYLDFMLYTVEQIYATSVRSDEGFARPLRMTQYPVMPRWFNIIVWILLIIGILTVIFIGYKLVPYLEYVFKWIFNKI